jgi:hypothetical protein
MPANMNEAGSGVVSGDAVVKRTSVRISYAAKFVASPNPALAFWSRALYTMSRS